MKELIEKIRTDEWPVSIANVYKYCEENNLLEEFKEWQTMIIALMNQHNQTIEKAKLNGISRKQLFGK